MKVRQAVKQSLLLLSRRDRRLLALSIGLQMSTSLLDLAGVLLLGLVAAVGVTVVQSQPPPAVVEDLLSFLGLDGLSDQQIVMYLAVAAASVLLAKSVISVVLIRRILRFLANRQALVSARLTAELLSRPLPEVQARSTQETAYALMGGVGAATVGLLGQVVIALSEVALLLVLGSALLLLDPVVTLGAIAFFIVVAVMLQKVLGSWATQLGREGAALDIASLNSVQEAISAYREITVAGRRDLYATRIEALRWRAANASADLSFLGQIPKYVFEVALVLGAFLLAVMLFLTRDAVSAVGTLSLFLVAGSRVMPSLLRLQGASLAMRAAAGGAEPTFALASDLNHGRHEIGASALPLQVRERIARGHPDFVATVQVEHVNFSYPASRTPALKDVSISVSRGEALALVGKSGAGKSTLADVILGIVTPQFGSVKVGGLSPELAIATWPGGIGYVPQEVVLANDTIRANVALGLPRDAVDDSLVWQALERAHFADYVNSLSGGLDACIGERGTRLSGGQRQRLGLARALYTNPSLLVLDEATSALDAETESEITKAIAGMRGEVTTIIIAHRLSTVMAANRLAYLESGRILTLGTFAEVAASVPAFHHQADLMGLTDSKDFDSD